MPSRQGPHSPRPVLASLMRQYWDVALLGVCLLVLAGCLLQSLRLEPLQQLALKTAEPPQWVAQIMDKPTEIGLTEETGIEASKPPGTFQKALPKKQATIPIVNINQASSSLLCALPGIGPKMAERILAYRKAHGPFASIEALQDVKGIGPKKLDKLRPYLKI